MCREGGLITEADSYEVTFVIIYGLLYFIAQQSYDSYMHCLSDLLELRVTRHNLNPLPLRPIDPLLH